MLAFRSGPNLRAVAASVTACLAVAGAARGEGPFVLSDAAMDGITAAGTTILADADAFATAFGPSGVSSSLSDTSIRPDGGIALGDALAGGDEGGYAQAFGGLLVELDGGGAMVDAGAAADAAPGGTLATATIEAGASTRNGDLTLLSRAAAAGDGSLSAGAIGGAQGGGALEAYGSGSGTESGSTLVGLIRSAGPVTNVGAAGVAYGAEDADTAAAATMTVDGPDGPITMTASQEGYGLGETSTSTGVVRVTAIAIGPVTVMRSVARSRGDGADGGIGTATTSVDMPEGATAPLMLRTRNGAGFGRGGTMSSTIMVVIDHPTNAWRR